MIRGLGTADVTQGGLPGRGARPALTEYRMTDRDRLKFFLVCALAGVATLLFLNAELAFITTWTRPRMTALHTLLELFAISIAILVVTSAWHTFDTDTAQRSQAVIAGFTVVAVCDMLHVLSFPGMPAFVQPSSTGSTIFYWLMGRSAEALTIALITFSVAPKLPRGISLLIGLAVAAAIAVFGMNHLADFPQTYIDGVGLTPFKVQFEMTLSAINALLAVLLWIQANRRGSRELALMSLSSLFTGLGGLAFASYVVMSDIQNLGGHVFKIAAYALLYRAIFIANTSAPFAALKASEAQNREYREVMKTLGANLHNSIIYQVIQPPTGMPRFTQVSDSVERILGLKPDVLYQDRRAWMGLLNAADVELVTTAERRSLESMTTIDVTVRMTGPDGRERRMHCLAAPRRLGDGSTVWDGLASDITERLQAEETRRKLEAELNQAHKMESIGTLASGIAHDFNNVLAAIIGNTRMAIEDIQRQDPGEAMTGLLQIQKSAQRAKSLVDQILSFSRKQAPMRTLLPVRRVIEDALSLLKTTLPKNIVLDERFEDGNACALVDSTQIEQVVVNLCTNAWHAIGDSTGRIGIQTEVVQIEGRTNRHGTLLPGRYIRIRVEDDGCGMDAATLQRVFEPFFTTKPLGVGTGLGMPVVYRIVTAHDGAITVQSRPGEGTCFEVFLPVAVSGSPAPQDVGSAGASRVAGNGERILYVDDDPLMAQMVERLLTRARFQVRVMNDPVAALALLGRPSENVDVLVTDYNMPGMTGLELIRSAREQRKDLQVILLSGYVSDQLRQTCARQQVGFVMEKQKSLDELCGAIEQALNPH